MTTSYMSRRIAGAGGGLMLALALMNPIDAQQAPGTCRVTGKATSGTTPLPGVAIAVKSGDAVKGITSTETDGGFGLTLAPGAYTISADLTGFSHVQQPVTIPADGACSQTLNFSLTLTPRSALPSATRGPAQGTAPVAGGPAGRGAAAGATAAGGRGRGTGFQTLGVEPQA